MILALLQGIFRLIRFALGFNHPKEETERLDEICRQFGMLQLDLSDADALSTACIYLADPHKLPGPAKDDSDNATKANDSATVFHYERTNEQNGLSKQYQVNDMSISDCDSDFEETLRHHFQYVPRPKADKEVEKNDDSSIDFASSLKQKDVNGTISVLVALTESSRSHISPRKRNFSLQNATETVSTSNSKSPSSEGKKRRRTNYHFDETNSPVQQFCSTSIVASTPLSTKLDSERRTRLTLINSAVRTKVRQSKQRTLLNLSTNNTDPMNTVNSKDETTRREQGAIAKHIARIRTSSSRLNSSKEAFLSFNDTSRYYSMRTSFSSNGSASFS